MAALGLVTWSWWTLAADLGDLVSARRLDNLRRFVGELTPEPWRGGDASLTSLVGWVAGLLRDGGLVAIGHTLAVATLAVLGATAVAVVVALPASATFGRAAAFLGEEEASRRTPRGLAWAGLRHGLRFVLIVLRAVPEYAWAFLLVGCLGISFWPAVIALTLHVGGILGKLGTELVEDLPPGPLTTLRGLGARRWQAGLTAVLPTVLPRFLVYVFYRFETCLREAVVLGMLGLLSLGYLVSEARVRDRYDEMLVWLGCGAALVLIGDLLSGWVRARVRAAG